MQMRLNLVTLLLLVSLWADAQGVQTDSTARKLEEIVVTASKFPQPLRNAAGPVTVITRDVIEQFGSYNLAQLLQSQSGIMVNGAYSSPGLNKSVYIRGAVNEYALILLDGIPISDPSGVGGAIDLRLLPLGQIERIEIMKGSQSSLYGSGAVSGVINIITAKGGDKKLGVNGRLSMGVLDAVAGRGPLGNGALDVMGTTGKFNYSAGVQGFFTDGISEAAPRTGGLSFEPDGFSQAGANLRLGFKPVESVEISPYVRYSHASGQYDGDSFADNRNNNYTLDMINAGMAVDYRGRVLKARLTYGYTHNDRTYRPSSSMYRGRLHDVDGYAYYEFNDKFGLSAGFNYRGQIMLNDGPGNTEPSVYILSPYVLFHARPLNNKKLIVELSYRLNAHSTYGLNSTYAVTPSYQITDAIKVFASYNTGYKAPTLSQLYGRYSANPSLKPQTSVSWEAGAQYRSNNGRITATATYYDRNIEDWISYSHQARRYVNIGRQHNNGVETAISWQITPQLRTDLSYDFILGSTTLPSSRRTDSTFSNLIRIPQHSAKLALSYRPIKSLLISLNGQYIGSRSDANFADPGQTMAALRAYVLLNAYIEYAILEGKLSFFADLKNITDTRFQEAYGYTVLPFGMRWGIGFRL